ncbi:MAG: hypothetical protein KC413_06940, partial [Anaerolineales bacterium]|nr:hypothetical protein [Anaerolineales bacterium]
FREVNDRHGETGVLLYVGLLAHLTDDNKAALAYNQQALEIAKTLGARHEQSLALLNLGHVYQAYGAAEMSHTWYEKANQAYQQAREILQTLGHEHLAMEAIAGLARTHLAQGNLEEAQQLVELILTYLQTHSLAGTDQPILVYYTCYQVLCAVQDRRAQQILITARDLVVYRASRTATDAQRLSFLKNVKANRRIMDEFAMSRKS